MYSKKKDQAEGVDASVVESSAEGGAYVCGALLETVGGRLACGWGQCRHRVARHSLEARQAIWDGIVAALPPAERTTVRPLTTCLFTGGIHGTDVGN